MWGWFGGGAAAKKDAPKKAILQLRGQLEMLSKREKHLQNQMDEQDNLARKYVNTNKNGKSSPTILDSGESGQGSYVHYFTLDRAMLTQLTMQLRKPPYDGRSNLNIPSTRPADR